MNDLERDTVLRELGVLSGKTFPANFFRRKRTNPAVKGLYEYHNLVRGIYKPTGCEMATAILQTLKGPYADALHADGGTWHLEYLQQGKGKAGWDNLSLERCISGAPVAVIIQQSTKNSTGGSTYKILGLGRVESYDKEAGLFKVTRWDEDLRTGRVKPTERDISAQEKAIIGLLRKPFKALEDSKPTTLVRHRARAEAFRRQVITFYDGRCAICGSQWVVDGKYEAQAAHIIPKARHGSDDPRNGIALCRFHHWTFDRGLFSLTDQGSITISARVSKFSDKPEVLKEFEGARIHLPVDARAHPDQGALEWHRREIFLD